MSVSLLFLVTDSEPGNSSDSEADSAKPSVPPIAPKVWYLDCQINDMFLHLVWSELSLCVSQLLYRLSVVGEFKFWRKFGTEDK